MISLRSPLLFALLFGMVLPVCAAPLRALILDGQNNHGVWPKSTAIMKGYLEGSDRFEVDVVRTAYTWKGEEHLEKYALDDGKKHQALEEPKQDPNFQPEFADYDVVISNFGWKAADWPADTQTALEDYLSSGGGFVVVHAANNSFPQWQEYNRMIGLGGWGDRDEKAGPYVYYDDKGGLVRDESPGRAGGHGPKHEFTIQIREPDHPITQGMPLRWRHTIDECYDKLRGPAENMTVLATAYSDPENKGTGRHEPMLMTLNYGEGRVFHTTLGHDVEAFESVGFIVSFKRGVEWAATGDTDVPIPDDFPSETKSSQRSGN